MTIRVRVVFALAMLACALCAVASARAEPEPIRLPLHFQIATEDGEPVAPDRFIAGQVRRANAIFAPYDVRFENVGQEELATRHARMETRRDRHVLGARVKRGVINCFVVASLRDVDDPTRMRSGVHWHSRTHPGAHYVILSAVSEPDVLAHELGHFLGNRRHSNVRGNLMSYLRGEGLPTLDRDQTRRMRKAIRGFLRTGELNVVDGP